MRKFMLGATARRSDGDGLTSSGSPLSACAIDHAVYKQKGNPVVSMGIAKQGIKTSFASG